MNKKSKFFDDPIIKIWDWYRHVMQRQMRKSIDLKYDKKISNQIYWTPTTKDENLGLSDDKIERLSQRSILSQIGYLIAQRLWAKRTFIFFPIFFIFGVFFCFEIFNGSRNTSNEYFFSIVTSLCLVLGLIIAFGCYLLTPLMAQIILPNTAVNSEEINTIENMIKRTLVKDLDHEVPKDFTDRLRLLDVDAEGKAVAGQILAYDLEVSAIKKIWEETSRIFLIYGFAFLSPALVSLFPNLSVLIYLIIILFAMKNPFKYGILAFLILYIALPMFMLWGFSSYSIVNMGIVSAQTIAGVKGFFVALAPWTYCTIAWILAIIVTILSKSPLRIRGEMLEEAVKQTGTELLIDKAGIDYFKNLEKSKNIQLNNAKKDKSPFIELGKSTGIFAQRRDPFSPTEPNIPMGLTINDLATHLFTIGASGTGKTSGVIRPIAHKWLELNRGGMFAVDGKFALPLELANLSKDFILISPKGDKFNPIENMNPDSVADIICEICKGENEEDPFWSSSASLMLRMATIIIKYSSKPFTLGNIYNFIMSSEEIRNKILNDNSIKDLAKTNYYLYNAIHYWKIEYPEIPEKTLGCVINVVRSWLGAIIAHEKLGEWVNTEKNKIAIESVFEGSKIGLLLPEAEYGQGGLIISALCMRRIYDQAKLRGDNWINDTTQKPVLLIADEVQNLLTEADIENVPLARSLGLYIVMSTQNIDGLYKRLDEEGAKQMLGNFSSLIVLPPKTEDSNKYISQRVGKVYKALVERFEGLPDAKSDIALYLDSGTDKLTRDINLYNQALLGNPRLSFLVGDKKINDEEKEVYRHNTSPSATLNLKLENIIDPEELDTLLAVPQSAIAIINRGRVPRRDVINLELIKGGK